MLRLLSRYSFPQIAAKRSLVATTTRLLSSTTTTTPPPPSPPTPTPPSPTTPSPPPPPPSRKDRVTIEKQSNGVVIVTLNRPQKHNALDMDMFRSIQATAVLLRKDRSVRCVVLRGAGPSFCSGLDFSSVMKNPLNLTEIWVREDESTPVSQQKGTPTANIFQDVAYAWRALPVPVIAVTHGNCFGGGFQIALGCDFRISSPECRFSIMEIKWGLIPDMSIGVTLRELVPIDVAKELTMTGRIFSADDARRMNIVTRVAHDPFKEALDLANSIATRSPDAVCGAKKLFNDTWTMENEGEVLKHESRLQLRLMWGWNMFAAAMRALFRTKTPYKKRLRRWGW